MQSVGVCSGTSESLKRTCSESTGVDLLVDKNAPGSSSRFLSHAVSVAEAEAGIEQVEIVIPKYKLRTLMQPRSGTEFISKTDLINWLTNIAERNDAGCREAATLARMLRDQFLRFR